MCGLKCYLGAFHIRCDEQSLPVSPTVKPQSPPACLAVQHDYPQSRETWPAICGERPGSKTRGSLTMAVWRMHHDSLAYAGLILSDAHAVRFDLPRRTSMWMYSSPWSLTTT